MKNIFKIIIGLWLAFSSLEAAVYLTKIGHFGGSPTTANKTRDVIVVGDYAYLADRENGLVIVDVRDKENPTLSGRLRSTGPFIYLDGTNGAYGVTVVGDYAYVADVNNGLLIVDIRDKANPTLSGSYDTGNSAKAVTVVGDYAYIADNINGLLIVDIRDKANPTLVGSYDTAGNAYAVTVVGDYAYVGDVNNGFLIVDIRDKANPTLSGSYGIVGWVYGVTVVGDYAYFAHTSSGLDIIDIREKINPTLSSTYAPPGTWASDVKVVGDYAYFSDGSNGLTIVDIRDKANPTLCGSYDTDGSADGVAVVGDYAYIADRANGLVILDIKILFTLPLVINPKTLINYTINITDTDTDIYGIVISEFYVDYGDGNYVGEDISTTSFDVKFDTAGTYTIGVKAIDDAGKIYETTKEIVVEDLPAQEMLSFIQNNPTNFALVSQVASATAVSNATATGQTNVQNNPTAFGLVDNGDCATSIADANAAGVDVGKQIVINTPIDFDLVTLADKLLAESNAEVAGVETGKTYVENNLADFNLTTLADMNTSVIAATTAGLESGKALVIESPSSFGVDVVTPLQASDVTSLPIGWSMVAIPSDTTDLSIFDSAQIVWYMKDDIWSAYTSNTTTAIALGEASIPVLTTIPANSAIWVEK